MKIRKLSLLLILGLVFFTGCNNDDDSNQSETLNGIWNLKNISGGFPGADIDYENGIVTWEFIPENKNLIVTSSIINNGPQSVYLPIQSGNYTYSLTESNGKTFIQIEGYGMYPNGEYGKYEINNNGELIIDQGEGSNGSADDVFILLFD
jgi:hypothetical protein